MSPDDNYTNILLEEIRDQNRAVLEAVGAMQVHVSTIPALHVDLAEVKTDLKTIKVAVTETNKNVRDHELRLTRLEQAS